MTGAMYAAISGLKAHMNKLNVIANNISNVNTYGYKSQRYVFHETMYTTSQSGSNGTTRTGGTNPSQIGYGSVTGSIDLDMSTGTYAPGKASDCMINGDGFFVVGDKDLSFDATDPNSLKSLTLTRLGDIEFKADGYLSDDSGNVIYGFLCTGYDDDGNPIVSDQLVPIRYPKMYTQETPYTVDDYKEYLLKTVDKYTLSGDPDAFDPKPTDIDGNEVTSFPLDNLKEKIEQCTTLDEMKELIAQINEQPMYNVAGQQIADDNDPPEAVIYNISTELTHEKGSAIYPTFFDPTNSEMNPNGVGLDDDGNLIDGTLDSELTSLTGHLVDGGSYIDASGSELVNTYPWLSVDSITIDGTTGRISAVTKETDEEICIGYIAIGNVTNPNGVSHIGGPYYKCSDGAGDLSIGLMGGAGKDLGINYVNGSLAGGPMGVNADDKMDIPAGMRLADCGTTELITGGLELSKTDLATEISEMITTQRGYQANTRIVTVTDSMLEELVNMKR